MQKHRILIFPLLGLSLFSCSQSEPDEPIVPEPDNTQTSIAFSSTNNNWQDAKTKAAGNGLETIFQTFRTWGYKTTTNSPNPSSPQIVMDGYKMSYNQGSAGSSTTNTADWEYDGIENPISATLQTIKYWDYSATSYRFFAYSPFNPDVKTSVSSGDNATATLSFNFEYSEAETATSTPYASRLWLASPSSTSPAYGSCVTLTFAPIIAKVRFRFTYPDGTTNVAISNIKFRDSRFVDTPANADTPLRGTIDAAYPLTGIPVGTFPTLTMSKSEAADASGLLVLTTPYEEAGDQIHILKDPTLYNKWYYVPPLANIPYEQGAYTITINIGGKTVSATVPAQYMQWKAGCQYTYIFKLSDTGDSISFNDLMVEQWLPGADIKNNGSGTEDW